MTSEIDEETAAYVIENRTYFDDLRQVAAQLAGLLVLAASAAKTATPHHPMLDSADQLYREALDGLRHARVTPRAWAHHRHVTQAAAEIGMALSSARKHLGRLGRGQEMETILAPLRAGYSHRQCAADALPGFELIAFAPGCCAHHLAAPLDEARVSP